MTVRTLLAGVLVAGCLLAPVASAAPAPANGACADDSGVTVVVDFTELGGHDVVRCAPGSPSSGLDALSGAGFSYSFVPNRPGFVCTIDGAPEPCNGAPADAYWSYWYAPRGGQWTYASTGAGSRTPPPGSVEGWAFGAGDPPSTSPPPPATTTTTTTTTTVTTTTASTTTAPVPATAAAGRGDTPTTTAPVPATTTTTVAVVDPDDVGSTTTDVPRTESTVVEPVDAPGGGEVAAPVAEPDRDGNGLGAVTGLAVAVVLAGGAVLELRRRRSRP